MRPPLKLKIVLLFALLTAGEAVAQVKSVFMADYFPVDRKTFCRRTFDWTVGQAGQTHSEIIGSMTVPYKSGPLSGPLVCQIAPGDASLSAWHNDGNSVIVLLDSDHYPSTDQSLTTYPPEAVLGVIQDKTYMPLSPTPTYAVKKGLTNTYISGDWDDTYWFRIQDVTLRGHVYRDTVIMWELETGTPVFPPVIPHSKYAELGITPPTVAETLGRQVNGIMVIAKGVGLIAAGSIEGGQLVALGELASISCNDKAPVFDAFDVPGTRNTRAQGANENGDVVGEYQWNSYGTSTATAFHGFLKNKHGELTTIDVPGAYSTSARDINNRGDIVGSYRSENTPASLWRGFVLSKGRFTFFDFPVVSPGVPNTQVAGINSRGDIVGTYFGPPGPAGTNAPNTTHAFLLRNGSFTVIDYPGAARTVAQGVNESGDIVGTYGTISEGNGTPHGFVLSNGVFSSIDFPGALSTAARGINAAGDIVGVYAVPPFGLHHGFLLTNGVFQTIDAPCGLQTRLHDITDQGDAIGEFVDSPYLEPSQTPDGRQDGAWYGFRVSKN